jgi:hypothetical protein
MSGSPRCRNDLVRRHFADPRQAWDEALRNDGGIGQLANALRPISIRR